LRSVILRIVLVVLISMHILLQQRRLFVVAVAV
jgi:hypothetical protein